MNVCFLPLPVRRERGQEIPTFRMNTDGSKSRVLRALLFDMDGTLTAPMLDFPKIKAEMGIGSRPILEALATMTPREREVAETVLHRHEDEAAEQSTLNDGCMELLNWIADQGWRTAIVTRNRLRSARKVMERHAIKVDVLLTRDDGLFKPDPEPLWLACRRLEVQPAETWMIGDGHHDIEAGLVAGIRTVWISHGRPKFFAAEPWKTVTGLTELHHLLRGKVKRD